MVALAAKVFMRTIGNTLVTDSQEAGGPSDVVPSGITRANTTKSTSRSKRAPEAGAGEKRRALRHLGNSEVTEQVHPLDALGSPLRRDLLRALRAGPLAVGELAQRFPVSRPAISKHLRVLEEAGLVTARHEGTRALYAVEMRGLATVRGFLDEFWSVALARLEELAQK